MSLLSSSWHCCSCCNGVAIVNAQASLQSRSLCRCCNNVVALVAMALLPSSSWCHCPHYNGVVAIIDTQHLCHCHDGVIALIVLVPLATLHRCCCPYCAGIVVLIALTSLPSLCMGVVTVITPALLPPSKWHVCAIALVSSPLSCWSCHPWCTGISALVMQASLHLLCLYHAVDSQASSPLLSWHVLSHR